MSEPIGGPHSTLRGARKFFHTLMIGGATLALLASGAQAGAMRSGKLSARAIVQIQKADPNSDYWVKALKRHALILRGPKTPTVITLNADGSVPDSAFMQYMKWRQGLNIKRFDSFHPELVRLLRKVKTPTTTTPPGTIEPPSPGVPIEPPDFTPIVPQELTPPNVPEPSSVMLGLGMLGAVAWYRRRRA